MALARAVSDVFIVAAKRTPFGTYGGKLKTLSATDLQEVATRAALAAGNIKPEWVNSIIIGNVFHATADGAYLPRHVGIRVGIPTEVPALALNRLCGSSFQSIATASDEINCGLSDLVVTGGAENMSLSPHSVRGIRFGLRLGENPVLDDTLWTGLIDQQIKTPMGMTAENLAEKYNISRTDADKFALRSHLLWTKAQESGYFKDEISPVTLKTRKGEVQFETDEHARPDATLEQMAKLPPVFKKQGTVNAANASGICDGAGCVIVANEAAIKRHNLKPLARVAGYGVSGCDPSIMGIGPVPAIKALMSKLKMSLDQMGLIELDTTLSSYTLLGSMIEAACTVGGRPLGGQGLPPLAQINEAFASQTLACQMELKIDMDKLNTHGGAIAIGHPVGASGSRITAHLTHKMRREGVKYAIGSACIGGGQGIALLLENVN